jgi:hypothetical protein
LPHVHREIRNGRLKTKMTLFAGPRMTFLLDNAVSGVLVESRLLEV